MDFESEEANFESMLCRTGRIAMYPGSSVSTREDDIRADEEDEVICGHRSVVGSYRQVVPFFIPDKFHILNAATRRD